MSEKKTFNFYYDLCCQKLTVYKGTTSEELIDTYVSRLHDDNLDIDIDIALQRTTIKKRNYKNRQILGERNVLTVSEIEMICNYFYDKVRY